MVSNFISCIKNSKRSLICGANEAIKNVDIAIKADV